MKWHKVDKSNSQQPSSGTYSDWKEQVAQECNHQCVYCAIGENDWGGTRNFHIDHYRPKSHEKFKSLENDIKNLFYSCCVCNVFKGSDWPGEPLQDLSSKSYPNPSQVDYNDIFVSSVDGTILGRYCASKYMVVRLYLNRPQLITLRRKSELLRKFQQVRKLCELKILPLLKRGGRPQDSDYLAKILERMLSIDKVRDKLSSVRPYESSDTRRR